MERIGNITFTLIDGALYAYGDGCVSSSINENSVVLNRDKPTRIDLCIKTMEVIDNDYLCVYNTQDIGYEYYVHDGLWHSWYSYVQSRTGMFRCIFGVGIILSVIATLYIQCDV